MRVVAGTLGGRQLRGPEGSDARPTMDKVRGAIFNSLVSLGAVQNAAVVDLFAGTGAFAIEAISRGASSADIVEKSAKNAALIRQNLAELNVRAQVYVQDVMAFVRRDHHYDLAFVDPPYVFDQWPVLLGFLRADLVVCESNRPVEPPGDWTLIRQKTYGGTHVTILEKAPS
jgi:16S rRNA (guanine966-N2)-methyltransferase